MYLFKFGYAANIHLLISLVSGIFDYVLVLRRVLHRIEPPVPPARISYPVAKLFEVRAHP